MCRIERPSDRLNGAATKRTMVGKTIGQEIGHMLRKAMASQRVSSVRQERVKRKGRQQVVMHEDGPIQRFFTI